MWGILTIVVYFDGSYSKTEIYMAGLPVFGGKVAGLGTKNLKCQIGISSLRFQFGTSSYSGRR